MSRALKFNISRDDPRENQNEPNWRAFGRYLAIGYLRGLGLLPMPEEVRERLIREGKTHLLPPSERSDYKT